MDILANPLIDFPALSDPMDLDLVLSYSVKIANRFRAVNSSTVQRIRMVLGNKRFRVPCFMKFLCWRTNCAKYATLRGHHETVQALVIGALGESAD